MASQHKTNHNHQRQISINFMNLDEPDNPMAIEGFHGFTSGYLVSPPLMARTFSLSAQQVQSRRRAINEDLEETNPIVQRKQKRQIKNRESAARSRARKLAYTNELENKISRLEEEIKRLRQEKEEEQLEQIAPNQELIKNQLRRTNSASF